MSTHPTTGSKTHKESSSMICLHEDALLSIFKMVVPETPYHLFAFACVCKSWCNVTGKEALWEKVTSKLKILDDKKGFLKEKVLQLYRQSKIAISQLEEEDLPSLNGPRQWTFTVMQRRLGNFMHANAHDSLRKTYAEKQQERKNMIEKLTAGFRGYCCLYVLGFDTLNKAKRVAGLLATDLYMEKEPLKHYQALCFTPEE